MPFGDGGGHGGAAAGRDGGAVDEEDVVQCVDVGKSHERLRRWVGKSVCVREGEAGGVRYERVCVSVCLCVCVSVCLCVFAFRVCV